MIRTRLFQIGGVRAPSARTSRRGSALRVELLEDRSVPATFPFTPNSFGGGVFNPFPGFTGQVEVASGDVNGDGVPDIITAEGPGAGSRSEVRIFDGAAAKRGQAVLIADFFPYSNAAGASQTPGFDGGVFVAAANFSGNGNGVADLVTSTGAGGQGHVKVFDFRAPTTGQFLGSDPTLLTSFIVYPGFQGAVTVAAINRGTGLSPLLVTASGAGTSAADIRMFSNAATIGSIVPGTLVRPGRAAVCVPRVPGWGRYCRRRLDRQPAVVPGNERREPTAERRQHQHGDDRCADTRAERPVPDGDRNPIRYPPRLGGYRKQRNSRRADLVRYPHERDPHFGVLGRRWNPHPAAPSDGVRGLRPLQ